jgi:hypothetical protein
MPAKIKVDRRREAIDAYRAAKPAPGGTDAGAATPGVDNS